MGGAGSRSLRGRFRIFTQYGRLGAHAHGETLRYTCRQTLKTPVPISCLAKGSSDHFYAGSDDRSVHVYNQETLKVVKSIRGLREVSSIVYMSQCAQCRWPRGHALRFTMDTEKMILAKAHATLTLELSVDHDMLNEVKGVYHSSYFRLIMTNHLLLNQKTVNWHFVWTLVQSASLIFLRNK
ncbi:hypothetical protein F4604DRAFT_926647 [Suillus subluteus]|nr:hypothetical protein F4604DRAFT_926647 [Suillus subluteus]